ncbi:MAG: amylo-alpha-1,6-glucosidase [Thermincolia bacterium]
MSLLTDSKFRRSSKGRTSLRFTRTFRGWAGNKGGKPLVVCYSPANEWPITPGEVQDATEVLKEGEVFVTSLPNGNILPQEKGELGLYYRDSRFLNQFEIFIDDQEPLFLSAETRGSHFAQVEMTNKEMNFGGETIPGHSLHIRLLRLLKHSLFQRLRIINFYSKTVTLQFKVKLGADYVDIFEVRGFDRPKRGQLLPSGKLNNGFIFNYQGLDGVKRSTEVVFSPKPVKIEVREGQGEAIFKLVLPPQKKVHFYLRITPVLEGEKQEGATDRQQRLAAAFTKAAGDQANNYDRWKRQCTCFISDNAIFNQMVDRAVTDLRSLSTHYPGWGTIIEAGIPWYTSPFGRDALITAWQSLIVNPELAKHTLRFLARFQGKKHDSWRDETPGKILHEIRRGEMATCGEIPHTPYYGSVDSTPLFIFLLAETYRWTGDRELLKEMVEPLRGCLEWCVKYGDLDGDGYLEYQRESERGLANQGWKDSWDGVIHSDGQLPRGPIALIEVQAYLYMAYRRAAELLEELDVINRLGQGEHGLEGCPLTEDINCPGRNPSDLLREARALRQKSNQLQEKFLQKFWMPDKNYLAYGLDGDKNLISTIVSNPGHCLMAGMLPEEMAAQVANRLLEPDMFSGWGIRTMSKLENPYNPMSYHNGSVWPHDNTMIAWGLRKYGHLKLLDKLATGLYEASLAFPYYRLPELFCGFTRRGNTGPVHYPIACDPQAWAVGSTFLLLHSLLGITCKGTEVTIHQPMLPMWVNELFVENMSVGDGRVDLEFTRKRGKTYCNVMKSSGNVRVIFEP